MNHKIEHADFLERIFPIPEFSDQEKELMKSLLELGRLDLVEHLQDPLLEHRTKALKIIGEECSSQFGVGITVMPNNTQWGKNVSLGSATFIGEYVSLQDGVHVGKFCYIPSDVTIESGIRIPDFTRIPAPEEGRILIAKEEGSVKVFQLLYEERGRLELDAFRRYQEKKYIGDLDDYVLFFLAKKSHSLIDH